MWRIARSHVLYRSRVVQVRRASMPDLMHSFVTRISRSELGIDPTDRIRCIRVTVGPVDVDRDIEIDDVTIL